MAGNAQNKQRPQAQIPPDRLTKKSLADKIYVPAMTSPAERLYKAALSVWRNAKARGWPLGFRKAEPLGDPVPTRAGARKDENPEIVKDKIPNPQTGQKSQRAQRDEFGLWYAWPHPYPGRDWNGYDAAYYGLYPATCDAIDAILLRLVLGELFQSQATLLIADVIRRQGPFVGVRRPPKEPTGASEDPACTSGVIEPLSERPRQISDAPPRPLPFRPFRLG